MTVSRGLVFDQSRMKNSISLISSTLFCGIESNISCFFVLSKQKRWMTRSRRVQERSTKKRVHDLEIVIERWKITSKILFLLDVLNKEPEQVLPARMLEKYRPQINLLKPHKVFDFVSKSPKLFELYRDKKGLAWCGLTKQAACLLEEEKMLMDGRKDKVAEYVTRMLMMSQDRTLRLDKIANFRRELGIPSDFRTEWIHMFPEHFTLIKINGIEHLELVRWNSDWAVTELEKRALIENENGQNKDPYEVPFPMKFPSNFKKLFRIGGKIDHFQKIPYVSPYTDANDLVPGSPEFDKRAVVIMHELLSFTMEKRLVTDHLTHFRREYRMPQKLMRLLLKHFGIFYVSERGKRFHVFLTEAYAGSELIERDPLVIWKEKIHCLTGYRGNKKGVKKFDEFSDTEGSNMLESNVIDFEGFDFVETMDALENSPLMEDAEMDIGDVLNAYKRG
ncbi:Ubiquitin carboxyl-terminal hydrolase family protein [Zostera marina]|uniref:Ubiquitin carboxyl-terminal hydrolase family protein n=1 Tax=Zostera marina TaxID=29655 RepID=A0A0K9PBU4_ZOSMR|nr:Ubiquitin carboxyl-terminal hydrolase family protein [Zostera marina]